MEKSIFMVEEIILHLLKYFNEMNIFNTVSLNWSTLNAPFPRTGYTVTLLPNGKIVFIGGLENPRANITP